MVLHSHILFYFSLLLLISPLSIFAFEPRTLRRYSIPDLSLSYLKVRIDYLWGASQTDLDTATHFLRDTVGYSCADGNYSVFGGDNTSSGGNEVVVIDISSAVRRRSIKSSATIRLHAGWYNGQGAGGTARVRASFINTKRNVTVETLTIGINPAERVSGCATHFVGRVHIEERAMTTGDMKSVFVEVSNSRDSVVAVETGRGKRRRKMTDVVYSAALIGTAGGAHLTSFDSLAYDCHAIGEHVLITDLNSNLLDVHARFRGVRNTSSLATRRTYVDGVAIRYANKRNIQLSLASTAAEFGNATKINSCPMALYVGGQLRPPMTDGVTGSPSVRIGVQNAGKNLFDGNLQLIVISFRETTLKLTVLIGRLDEEEGRCAIRLINLQLPQMLTNTINAAGLFGNPTGNRMDDWRLANYGGVASVPNRYSPFARLSKPAYEFCSSWCKTESSLFSTVDDEDNGDGTDDDNGTSCDAPFPGDENLLSYWQSANKQQTVVCGGDQQCVLASILAANAIPGSKVRTVAQQFIGLRDYTRWINSRVAPLRVSPTSEASIVTVTVDVRDRFDIVLVDVTAFALFVYDGATGKRGVYIGDLTDDGKTGDASAKDGVFTGRVKLLGAFHGSGKTFVAVPVTGRTQMFDSELAVIRVF